MNLTDHPVFQAIYDACQECEKLPASEQQTRTVIAIGAIALPATALLTDLRQAQAALREARKEVSAIEWGGHYSHFDRQGTAGANCPACHADWAGRDHQAAALATIDAALAPAEPTKDKR